MGVRVYVVPDLEIYYRLVYRVPADKINANRSLIEPIALSPSLLY
jgi:hypothetical protein